MRTSILFALLLGLLSGCDNAAPTQTSAGADSLPAGLILTAAPGGAVEIDKLRSGAKDGDSVVVRGVVGGRADPFVAERAVLTLLDTSVRTCEQLPGDTCKTPWDACCEPRDELAMATITVQVVGADGKPVKKGLSGAGGIAPLKKLVVAGTVSRSPDGSGIVVNAKGIFVEQ